MNIIIRECIISDYKEIYLLNKNEMGYDFPVEQTKQRLKILLKDKNHKINVAVCDEKVVGYIHANNYDVIYSAPLKNIMGVAVDGEFKRQGIGKMLLESIEEWAKAMGSEGVRLISGEKRTGAHAFYRACGYDNKKKQLNFVKIF